jgi:hypothetical protein
VVLFHLSRKTPELYVTLSYSILLCPACTLEVASLNKLYIFIDIILLLFVMTFMSGNYIYILEKMFLGTSNCSYSVVTL